MTDTRDTLTDAIDQFCRNHRVQAADEAALLAELDRQLVAADQDLTARLRLMRAEHAERRQRLVDDLASFAGELGVLPAPATNVAPLRRIA